MATNELSLYEKIEAYEELKKELNNKELYKKFFKKRCCLCNAKIPGNWMHYKLLGNFCGVCNSRCDRVGKNIITGEAAYAELSVRIIQVKDEKKRIEYNYFTRRNVEI